MNSTFLFSQKIFNQNYSFGIDEKTVAFVPIINNDFEKNDEIVKDILKDTLNLKFLDTSVLRTKLDAGMIDILKKIAETDYKTKELKKYPNLNTILEATEIDFIKQNFDDADLLLFPIVFDINQKGGMTFGSSKFRLYDLNSGEFIQQFSEKTNVNVSGDAGIEMMTAFLLISEKADLLKNYRN
jgi:hypothetical protein